MDSKDQEKCEGCKYSRLYMLENFNFIGCLYPPYHGKWVAEIEECPKFQEEYKSNKDTQVYCTQCKYLEYDNLLEMFTCKYQDRCDTLDVENSKPFSERPYYEKGWFED